MEVLPEVLPRVAGASSDREHTPILHHVVSTLMQSYMGHLCWGCCQTWQPPHDHVHTRYHVTFPRAIHLGLLTLFTCLRSLAGAVVVGGMGVLLDVTAACDSTTTIFPVLLTEIHAYTESQNFRKHSGAIDVGNGRTA